MSFSDKAPENAGWTLLALVVDCSGSMDPISADMERGIKALVEEQARGEETCLVTLTEFNRLFRVVFEGVPAANMPAYRLDATGPTALLDAIGCTIGILELRIDDMSPEDRPSTVIVAVITDGGENSSTKWSQPQVARAIKAKTAEGWHFTFLGADEAALEEGLSLGIDPRSLLTWEPSERGAAGALKSLSDSSRRVRSGDASRIEYTDDERLAAAGTSFAPEPPPGPRHPYLFLDVDGVLTVFEKDVGRDAEMFEDFAHHDVPFDVVAGYRRSVSVWLSPSMGARIARLPADIRWVTTWEHRAGSAIALRCGLPRDLPVLSRDDGGEEWELDWKFLAVRTAVDEDPRPFVWIDDDIDFLQDGSLTPRAWADGLAFPSLLIAPAGGTGLLARHLDLVEEFLRQHGIDPEADAGDET